jgi:hypothetical protein
MELAHQVKDARSNVRCAEVVCISEASSYIDEARTRKERKGTQITVVEHQAPEQAETKN